MAVIDPSNSSVSAPALSGLQKLIGYSARNPLMIMMVATLLAFAGYRSLGLTALDAIPDLSDPQVIVFTEWPGRSPDLVEDQITYPLTTSLLSAPGVQSVRGQSFMGLSFVYVVFEEGTDIYWARSRVLEYLNTATGKLPQGVSPTLGPDATAVGWVFQYALIDKSGQNSLADLRSLQDFTLRYWLEALKGVAEVASIGGFVKEYQINIDPNRLSAYGITLQQVGQAVRASNNDVGGRSLEIAGHEHFIRGRGYIQSPEDLEKVVLKVSDEGVPITLSQVATVTIGPAQQRGLADLDGQGQAVGGTVIMRYGEDALDVIERVKQRLQEAESSLPDGVEIVITYDRSKLINRAINTLRDTLVEEMVVVSLVIGVFLLHFRSALVACITIPVAILLAFIPMYFQGLTANIMSLGGIAVAIGAMVDGAIVVIDNVHKRLAVENESSGQRRETIIKAMQEVGPSVFFALMIITVSFLPVFALEGTEGRMFKPLAYTKTYAMFFSALLAVTLIPALIVVLIRGKIRSADNPLNRWLIKAYSPVVRLAIEWRWSVILLAVGALVATWPVYRNLGNEFMPPLNEGSILYMPTSLPGMSITEAGQILQSMDAQLMQFPEVEHVFGKIGRSTTATDSAPLSMVEAVITLKPKDQWREGLSWDDLIAEMDQTLDYPGMPNVWWMPIQTRTEMLATGIRSTLGIKVFGEDLKTIETTAVAIENALQEDSRTSPYTRSAFAERLTGGYFLDFDINRDQAARFGLNVGEIEDVIVAAIGGMPVTEIIEGRERYTVLMRYARDYRESIDALERVLVPTKTGTSVPITQVAEIHYRTGPPMLRSEDGQLVGYVFVDVNKNIGIADYVTAAREVIEDRVEIPAGYRLAWAGQFTYFERAKAKLQILVPLALFLVFFMLYMHRGSLAETGLIMLALPFSLIGAIWMLALLQYNLSVAVWVGMIALAGLAAELGLMMIVYLDMACKEQQRSGQLNNYAQLTDALVMGAGQRIRPMLMTTLTLLLGLIPIIISDGTGADVMKRIAAPMVGGIGSALLMVLLVFPALYSFGNNGITPMRNPTDG